MINISLQQQSGGGREREIRNIILDSISITPEPSAYGTTAMYSHSELQSWGIEGIIITPYGIISFVPSDTDKLTRLVKAHDDGGLTYENITRQQNVGKDHRIPQISLPDTNPKSAKLRKEYCYIAINTKRYLGVVISGPDNKRLSISFIDSSE